MKVLENVRSRFAQRQERKQKMRLRAEALRAMNPIQKVVHKCVKSVEPQAADLLRHELDRIKAERAATLPIEADLRARLSKQIDDLHTTLVCFDLPQSYQLLDLSFLRWDWGHRKYPRFAVFRPSSDLCRLELGATRYSRSSLVSGGPFFYCHAHEDLPKAWSCQAGDKVTLRCHFTGSLPATTRDRIKQAGSVFGDEVFIAQNTHWKDWRVEKIREVRDPLVFGMRSGRAWLIDQFDVTPVEDYILTTHVGVESSSR